METPRDYPKKIIDNIFENDRSNIKPISSFEALSIYEKRPHLRTSPTYDFLHFAVISSLTVEDDIIRPGTLFMNEEVRYPGTLVARELTIADVDIVDAKGKLFQTRILIKPTYHNFGLCFGKVYDRADGFRAIAHIDGRIDSLRPIIVEPGVDASFSNHSNLENDSFCGSQLTTILILALESTTCLFFHKENSSFFHRRDPSTNLFLPRSDTGLMREMLCLLTNPNSVTNANRTIVQTLCAADIPQETIAEFAGGKYPVVSGGDDDQLDFLLDDLYPLIRMARLHDAGNRKDAVLTLKLWVFERNVWKSKFIRSCDYYYFSEYFNTDSRNFIAVLKYIKMNIDECIEYAETHTLGLAKNDIFWGWIQKHSLIVKEYESSFDRRVQYLCKNKKRKALFRDD